MPKDQKKNSYEDSDFQQVLDEIEAFEAERRTITAEAAGRSSAIAKKIADAKKTATKLKIPRQILSAVLKQRKLEQQLQDLADDVPEDMAEMYLDAAGQFSFLKPEDGEKPKRGATAATTAAGNASQRAAENSAKEGGKVLDDLVAR
jgi:hypothetical protein